MFKDKKQGGTIIMTKISGVIARDLNFRELLSIPRDKIDGQPSITLYKKTNIFEWMISFISGIIFLKQINTALGICHVDIDLANALFSISVKKGGLEAVHIYMEGIIVYIAGLVPGLC